MERDAGGSGVRERRRTRTLLGNLFTAFGCPQAKGNNAEGERVLYDTKRECLLAGTPTVVPSSSSLLRSMPTAIHLRRRRVVLVAAGLVVIAFVFLFRAWKANADRGGQKYAEPFRIAGNFYYVGANDVSSFLITGPQGHVLIDGGYPGTPPMILASIRKLGFDIRDVKVL